MWRVAPEVLRSARSDGYDSKQADVWSSGVMLYAMLFCCYPFDRREDANDPRAFAKITQRIFTGAPLPCPCSLQNLFHAADVKDAMGTLHDAKSLYACCAHERCSTGLCANCRLLRYLPGTIAARRPGTAARTAFVCCSNDVRCPGLMHVRNDIGLCCSGLRVPGE